jgi:Zn-dependent M28 family amino/carboxypeptidase
MKVYFLKIYSIVFILSACSSSGNISKLRNESINNLKTDIQYLSDDKLEGRRTGSKGEELASNYIINQFKSIGLVPKGDENYLQPFLVNDGKQIDPGSEFSINGKLLVAGEDFFPFPYSPNKKIEAMPAIALQEADMPWFIDLKESLEENKDNPHFDLQEYIQSNSKKAKAKGATAVLLYNSSIIDDKLIFNPKDKSEQLSIPVLYITKKAAQKYLQDKEASLDLIIKTSISEKTKYGHNVIGYIDNGAATTVVLGAHYDHLGYGEDGNSMIRNFDQPQIHNGADDNASGTAALIELARKLKIAKAKKNNYLFIAFSGEELGLFGSKYFTEHPTIDLSTVNYMINMDMLGRLNDSSKVLTVGGYGTSPSWEMYYFPRMSSQKNVTLRFKYDSSGTGPSDHTSFYRKNIPVLFYFTGLHSDYHKPTDDADKINYNGEALIVEHILNLVNWYDKELRLKFTKTRETQTSTSARFSVSLGIMPDYTYAGTGVRADGVTDGKPAQKAGLKTGDIIIQLGDKSTASLEDYMQALNKFKKGDKTKVKFKRGSQLLEATVEF